MKSLDLSGHRFGRLVVVSMAAERAKNGKIRWKCLCDCGGTACPDGTSLKRGNTRSCGCLHIDKITTHGKAKRGRRTREFLAWQHMIDRCSNPKSQRFDRYGARGISVCDEWLDFERFLSDMGQCPPGKTIERIDNDGGYSSDNCRWATRTEQARNTSKNRNITINGQTKCLSEWAKSHGVPIGTVRKRLSLGWEPDKALTRKAYGYKHQLSKRRGF